MSQLLLQTEPYLLNAQASNPKFNHKNYPNEFKQARSQETPNSLLEKAGQFAQLLEMTHEN